MVYKVAAASRVVMKLQYSNTQQAPSTHLDA
jgi:hypothetical protein